MSNYSLLMRQTVKKFWQDVNWENRPVPVALAAPVEPKTNSQAEISDTVVSSTPSAPVLMLDFKMTVRNYFDAIPWTGVPLVAAPPIPVTVVEDSKYKIDTLDDFLADISQFF